MGKALRLKKSKKTKVKDRLNEEQMKELIDKLKNSEVEVQEQEACYHLQLNKLKDDSMWYQCKKCGQIVFIVGAAIYNKKILATEMEEVLSNVK